MRLFAKRQNLCKIHFFDPDGVIFANFFAPYGMLTSHKFHLYAPPQITKINFFDKEGNFHIRPFIYRQVAVRDPKTLRFVYQDDLKHKDFIYFFVRGEPYTMLGFIKNDIHFFGVKEGKLFLLGTDIIGRDLLSRIIFGGRVSLSIGLIGVIILVIIGTIVGFIVSKFNTNKMPQVCKSWSKNHIMEISLFLTGFIGHYLFEYMGLKKWYCKHGRACSK